MKLSDALVHCLQEEKVEVIFGYPGATVVDIFESLRASSIHHVLVRQEQAAVHSASGYARESGKVGVCLATSGPGATNLITGIATAYMDSIPLVIITGQVKTNLIGRDVFQEVDITGATEPFIKHSYLVKEAKQLPRIIKEAFYIASTGRPGPVLIDLPTDIQKEDIAFNYPSEVKIRGYKPTVDGHMGQIKKAVKVLEDSKRPLICIGGGVLLANARKELVEFAQKSGIPAVYTMMGKSVIPTQSDNCMDMIGTHGFGHANWAMRQADTIFFIGARIADRAVSNICDLDERATIIHIDIDPAEIGKIAAANIPIVGDAKKILAELNKLISPLNIGEWKEELKTRRKHKEEVHQTDKINPKRVIRDLSTLLSNDATITADVGQNQLWTIRNMAIEGERKILTSGGFGTMGYSLPAAVGASLANKDKKIVAIMGDGSFQMSFFELGTIIQEGIKPLIILFNNHGLGMVRHLQKSVKVEEYGVDLACNPEFTMITCAYGIKSRKVTNPDEVMDALKEAIHEDAPYFLEFIVDGNETTF